MKNIIFSGCSFTWGQGLWHYGNFDDIVKPIEYEFDRDVIKDSHIHYMEKNRFSYIVSKYFGKLGSSMRMLSLCDCWAS